jgi:type IV secretion system protein VirB11
MDRSTARAALETVAACRKTVISHDKPILETELPLDDSRFEGIISPVTRGPVFAIRMRPKKIYTLADYVAAGILTCKNDPLNRHRTQTDFIANVRGLDHAEILIAALTGRKNILLIGSTGSGKTTFVNALLADLALWCPDDRIVLIEDTVELQCAAENVVALRAAGSISMLDCLRAAMRLKPHRIIVGEVRGGEALTLLKAWNTGHPGGIATAHADNAYAGLMRLEYLVSEATAAPQQHLIAETVDLVVFIAEESALAARRKVKEIAYITGYRDGRYELEYL